MSSPIPLPLIQPYLIFGGRCEEALEFYGATLGAQVDMLMRFSECPSPMPPGTIPEGFENKIMHASFRVGYATLMASDGCTDGTPAFGGFSLSLAVAQEAEAEKFFKALCQDGVVNMPLSPTFWSPLFGMVTDRFGISWMVNVLAAPATPPPLG